MVDTSQYQSDVLLLLVGANPLPNYVAARLLAHPSATLYLLHTEGEQNTHEIAVYLRDNLSADRPDLTIELRGIPRVDPGAIRARVAAILKHLPATVDVGLHYTGGTKPMAIHTYTAVQEAYPTACFSYLDAVRLELVLNYRRQPTQFFPVGSSVAVDFQRMFSLRGYTLDPPRALAQHQDVCRAILDVHLIPQGRKQWRDWLNTWRDPNRGPALPAASQYPALAPAIESFATLCGGTENADGVARALGYDTLVKCAKFLNGGWLEEHTLDAVVRVAEHASLTSWGIGLLPEKSGRRPFEIDVAAIRGYQLFAISCRAADRADLAKEHLMEVYVRARQIGSDEARIAVVCCVQDPIELQHEVEEQWDAAGKIRVFGQPHLFDLEVHLEDWFRTANREV